MLSPRLVRWRPVDDLDMRKVVALLEFLEHLERDEASTFDRFLDFSLLNRINVGYEDLAAAAQRRSTFLPDGPAGKSAFYAPNQLAYGLARMYQNLLDSPRIELSIFRDYQSAADWLGVDRDLLEH